LCHQAGTGDVGRKIVLHHRDDLLRQARQRWKDNPDLRKRYRRHRPNIERAIAQLASRGGRRLKLRYRGTANNNAWLKRRTAALNLRNLIAGGLTRTAAGWILATA
jgi:Transposase DDE domain